MRKLSGIIFGSLLFPAQAFADAEQTTGHHGWGMMPWGMGGMMFMMPVMFILVVAVIFTVIFMIRRTGGEGQGPASGGPSETALEILKKRYARGDIDREEFDRMKKDLQD